MSNVFSTRIYSTLVILIQNTNVFFFLNFFEECLLNSFFLILDSSLIHHLHHYFSITDKPSGVLTISVIVTALYRSESFDESVLESSSSPMFKWKMRLVNALLLGGVKPGLSVWDRRSSPSESYSCWIAGIQLRRWFPLTAGTLTMGWGVGGLTGCHPVAPCELALSVDMSGISSSVSLSSPAR